MLLKQAYRRHDSRVRFNQSFGIADVVFAIPSMRRKNSEYLMDTMESVMLHAQPRHVLLMKTGVDVHPEYEAVVRRYPNVTTVCARQPR